jgi:hypothetical protein
MQFNYQNVKVEEEEKSNDFRTYGLLNKNLVNDEQEYNNYMINLLEKKLYLAEQNNLALEELNKKYVEDINNLTQSLNIVLNEFSNKIKKIENMSK